MQIINNEIIQYIITAISIPFLIILLGKIISLIINIIASILSIIIPKSIIYHILNYVTFVGTVIHELSHGLVATILGAKVLQWNLFKPGKDSLGSIVYQPQGNYFQQALQMSFSGIAPIPIGLSIIYILYKYALPNCSYKYLIYYLIISICIHLDLSSADIKNILKGLPAMIAISFLICLMLKINLVQIFI